MDVKNFFQQMNCGCQTGLIFLMIASLQAALDPDGPGRNKDPGEADSTEGMAMHHVAVAKVLERSEPFDILDAAHRER
ncbi:MAG: hypothetical protein PHV70_06010, partial [Desulfobacteraceae bacterium]|nr:hypothetical protein [Desulfobacteraceae bacterium]